MAIPYQLRHKAKTATTSSSSPNTELSILRGKPFWVWSKEEHKALHLETNGYCCFNHCVGLPQKDKQEFPLFDYEKLIYDNLFSNQNYEFRDKHLWILKSTGLGITEFFLRIIGWLCTKHDSLKG